MVQLLQYHAAAGAGKTHHLVSTYLAEALREGSFVPLLAITFTNKATQEMRERVVHYLEALAQEEDSSLARSYQKRLGWSPSHLKACARRLLSRLVHRYDELQVVTIDSFFQQSIRPFGSWLGVEGPYEIALDATPARDACTLELLTTLDCYPSIRGWLTDLALQKVGRGKAWLFTQELSDLGDALEKRIDATGVASSLDVEEIARFFAVHKRQAKQWEVELAAAAGSMLDFIASHQLEVSDFAWGEQGVVGFLKRLQRQQIAPPGARVRQAAADPVCWAKRGAPNAEVVTGVAREVLQPRLQMLLEWYTRHYRSYATLCALERLQPAFVAAIQVETLLQAYSSDRGLLFMSRLPSLLRKAIEGSSTSFFYGFLGRSYHTFLIDEFQDVSRTQWEGLRVLFSAGRRCVIVGDVKQAIYRWRGGDPSLFLSEAAQSLKAEGVQDRYLPHNFRSKEAIVSFNNHFFTQAAAAVTEQWHALAAEESDGAAQEALRQAAARVGQAYSHVAQTPGNPADQSGGYVAFRHLPTKEDSAQHDWKTQALKEAVAVIEQLQEEGYRLGDIAILVRDHQQAHQVLDYLSYYRKSADAKPYLHYEAVSSGGLRVGDHPVVRLVLAALHHLNDPTDRFYQAMLLDLYHTYGSATPEVPHRYFNAVGEGAGVDPFLPSSFVAVRSQLTREPLATLVGAVIGYFTKGVPSERPYMEALQELISGFARGGERSLAQFLNWWELEGKKSALEAPEAATHLKVLTIHQAKGLAFRVVLVPFCAWSLGHPPHGRTTFWAHTSQQPFAPLGWVPLYYGAALGETYYSADYYQEQHAAYLEGLNLLYVAFTRPRDRLYVWGPQEKGKTLRRVSHLWEAVRHRLPANPASTDSFYTFGVPSAPSASQQACRVFQEIPSRVTSLHRHQLVRAAVALPLITTGTLWHSVLAEVATIEDLAPTLARYVASQRLSEAQAADIRATFMQWCQDARVREWFSGAWTVKREASLLLESGVLFRPDRVVVRGGEAVVVDYKTGEAKEAHYEQVSNYARLLRQMGYTVQSYLLYTTPPRLVCIQGQK